MENYYCNKCRIRHRKGSKIYIEHKKFANKGRPKGSKSLKNLFSEFKSYFGVVGSVKSQLVQEDFNYEDGKEIMSVVRSWADNHKVMLLWDEDDDFDKIDKIYDTKQEKQIKELHIYSRKYDDYEPICIYTFYTYKNMLMIELDDILSGYDHRIVLVKKVW